MIDTHVHAKSILNIVVTKIKFEVCSVYTFFYWSRSSPYWYSCRPTAWCANDSISLTGPVLFSNGVIVHTYNINFCNLDPDHKTKSQRISWMLMNCYILLMVNYRYSYWSKSHCLYQTMPNISTTKMNYISSWYFTLVQISLILNAAN